MRTICEIHFRLMGCLCIKACSTKRRGFISFAYARWLDKTDEAQLEGVAISRWHAALDVELHDLQATDAIICLQVLPCLQLPSSGLLLACVPCCSWTAGLPRAAL